MVADLFLKKLKDYQKKMRKLVLEIITFSFSNCIINQKWLWKAPL